MSVFTRNAMAGRTEEDTETNKNESLKLKPQNLESKPLSVGQSSDSESLLLGETEILILTSHREEEDHCWEFLEEMTEIDLLESEAESFDWEDLVVSCLMNETAGAPAFSSTKLVEVSQMSQEEGELGQLREEMSDILEDWCFQVERR